MKSVFVRLDLSGTILNGHAKQNVSLGKFGMERNASVKRDMLVIPTENANYAHKALQLLAKSATALKTMNGTKLNGNASIFVVLMKSGMEKLVYVKTVLPDMVDNASHAHFILKPSMKNVFARKTMSGVMLNGLALQAVASGKNGLEENVAVNLDVEDIATIVNLAQLIPNHLMKNVSARMVTR